MTSGDSRALETWRRWTDAPLLAIAIGSLPLLLFGNDRADRWVACPALARTERMLKLLSRIAT